MPFYVFYANFVVIDIQLFDVAVHYRGFHRTEIGTRGVIKRSSHYQGDYREYHQKRYYRYNAFRARLQSIYLRNTLTAEP